MDPQPSSRKTEEEWKRRLTPEQYALLRDKGTEVPFTGHYVSEKRDGIYRCAACGSQLFSSEAKFDSGTGWPSFDQELPARVREVQDWSQGMERMEVVCGRCGSHLGHVFGNGPTATGRRYCLNSIALQFKPERE